MKFSPNISIHPMHAQISPLAFSVSNKTLFHYLSDFVFPAEGFKHCGPYLDAGVKTPLEALLIGVMKRSDEGVR
jgi:hypothetical protein